MATAKPVVSNPVAANAAFLQEIRDANDELWQLLGKIADYCRSSAEVQEHAAQLADTLVELRDQLALHFALEEAFGCIDDADSEVPAVTRQLTRTRGEHRQLYARASRLAAAAERLLLDGKVGDFLIRVPLQFRELEQQLRQHESRENELVMRQFDDLGQGD